MIYFSGSQLGKILSRRGHSAMSEGIFGGHDWGGAVSNQQVETRRVDQNSLTTDDHLAPRGSSGKAEDPFCHRIL